jgi:hypothetical protein
MTKQISIVSAFGRGHAMAQSLVQQGLGVRLFDVSSQLGDSTAEDDEGPFGLLNSGLSSFDSQRSLGDFQNLRCDQGLTWMFAEGPFEMKGPLSSVHRQAMKVSDQVWDWSISGKALSTGELSKLVNSDFDQVWFFHLLKSLTANQWIPPFRAGLVGESLPWTADLLLRQTSRKDLQQSLIALSEHNVKVSVGAVIEDVLIENEKQFSGLEVRDQGSTSSQFQTCDQMIWCLSGEETEHLRLDKKIFSKGVEKSLFSWNRVGLRAELNSRLESLPEISVWLQDRALAWSHDNLFILRRTTQRNSFDLWVRTPSFQRENREYQSEIFLKCLQEIKTRIDISEIELLSTESLSQLQPPRHPVFESGLEVVIKGQKLERFFWVGPETWQGLGFNFMNRRMHVVESQVLAWLKSELAKQFKIDERERLRAARSK